MKSKLVGLREAWVEEEKEREARQSQRLDTFAKVRFCFVPLSAQNKFIAPFLSRRMPRGRKGWRRRWPS